jgi:regulator of RNase E activity RraA
MPGDLIYADSSGAVVIPAAETEVVVNLAREIADEEMNAREGITAEDYNQH